MNDSFPKDLQVIVERVVRPLSASEAFKRKTRQELLAHVTAVFEEELARLGSEVSAIELTRRRFGDATEITRELERAVPRLDLLGRYADMLAFRPGVSLTRVACNHLFISLAVFLLGFLLIIPAVLYRGRAFELALTFRIVLVLGLASGAFSFVLVYLMSRMARFAHGDPADKTRGRMLWLGFLSLAFFPAFGFAVFWGISLDLAMSSRHFLYGCVIAPLAPLLFIIAGRQAMDEERHREEWSALLIDEPIVAD